MELFSAKRPDENISDLLRAMKVEEELRTASQESQIESDFEALTPRQREARLRSEMVRNAFKQGESNPLVKDYEREQELDEIAAIMSDGTELVGNHTGGHRAHVSIDTDGEW